MYLLLSLLFHLPLFFSQTDTPSPTPDLSSPVFTINGQPMSAEDQQKLAGAAGAIGAIFFVVMIVVMLVLSALLLWKVFTKAGKPGWASLIPIYNVIIMLEIAGRPIWWIILFLIPFVNFIISIIVCIDIAKSFGKDAAFGLGLAFLGIIFFPILGFGSARYVGPSAKLGAGGYLPPTV